MASKTADTIIIGGGLSGWLTACALNSFRKQKIMILESEPQWGGLAHPHSTEFGILDYGLKLLPVIEGSEESLEFFEQMT